MLLDEDPASLIHECIGNFNIHPDRAALGRITSSLSTLSEARSLRVAEAASALKKVSRQLHTLNQQHELAVSSHNPTEHASAILALDAQKFKVAKEASDLEIEGERLETELGSLQGQLKELEAGGEAGGVMENGRDRDTSQDQAILKLKLYRSLGIDVEADTNGEYKKAIVRNAQKGTARVVEIDTQFSKSFYANHFWQTM